MKFTIWEKNIIHDVIDLIPSGRIGQTATLLKCREAFNLAAKEEKVIEQMHAWEVESIKIRKNGKKPSQKEKKALNKKLEKVMSKIADQVDVDVTSDDIRVFWENARRPELGIKLPMKGLDHQSAKLSVALEEKMNKIVEGKEEEK